MESQLATCAGTMTFDPKLCIEYTDISDIKQAILRIETEEDIVNKQLNDLLEHQTSLESKMINLHKMLPSLQLLQTDSSQLSGMINFTSTLAENVSSKVRKLDLAKKHVTGCLQLVDDILDLKFCTDGVQTALQNEDYEKAAGHIHRFRSLDENILRMSADASEGSTLETSFSLLHESENKLRTIVHNKFDAAVHSGDVASVERFFKIFPLLGLHDDGLTKFGKYLSAQLGETAESHFKQSLAIDADDKRAAVMYADAMVVLFESTARAVEIHQPLVETYYGPGKVFSLLKILQKECDRQSRKIIGEFNEKRCFNKQVDHVRQRLINTRQSSASLIPIDLMNLDILLAEVVLLNTRTELYLRFMKRRSLQDMEVGSSDKDNKPDALNEIITYFSTCDLARLLQELIGGYIAIEEYFMREMVVKAVNMDLASEEGGHTSSMVDDAFFIVKKCVMRALSSSSVDGLCAMMNHACSVLEQDFREVLLTRLRAGYPASFDFTHAYNVMQTSIQQGKLQSSDTDLARMSFIIALNNTSASCENIKKLRQTLQDEVSKTFNQTNTQNLAKLQSCLTDLGDVSNRFKDALEYGFTQLTLTAIKPRVKPIIDSFLTTKHNIDEDEFSSYEAEDPWVQNAIVNFAALLDAFKECLSTENYETFVNHLCSEIVRQLEKAVTKTVYNRLGGLQFDKELRVLVGYLTTITTWTIRDKFARLTQMATILNLEHVTEILDYWGGNSGPLTWRLTPTEVRQILSLRQDFNRDDVKKLKL